MADNSKLMFLTFSGFKFSEMEMSTCYETFASLQHLQLTTATHPVEVVLAVMLSTFTFERTEKVIQWNIAGVSYPTVEGNSQPQLPLKMGLYRP